MNSFKNLNQGFTMVEIMIVVLIIGILAAIAFPNYQDSIQKARRADGYESLLECAASQSRYFTTIVPSSYMTDDIAEDEQLCGWSDAVGDFVSPEGFYQLDIDNDACQQAVAGGNVSWCFTITATPVAGGAQANDVRCAEFTVDERGNQAAEDSSGADNTDYCWRN